MKVLSGRLAANDGRENEISPGLPWIGRADARDLVGLCNDDASVASKQETRRATFPEDQTLRTDSGCDICRNSCQCDKPEIGERALETASSMYPASLLICKMR